MVAIGAMEAIEKIEALTRYGREFLQMLGELHVLPTQE